MTQLSPGASNVPLDPSCQSFTVRVLSPVGIGLMTNLEAAGTTIDLLERLIGHIGLTIMASIPGCMIGPPLAIE